MKKQEFFATLLLIAGVSSIITYIYKSRKSKNVKSSANTSSETQKKDDDEKTALEIVDEIKTLDSSVTMPEEENAQYRNEKRNELTEKLRKLGYSLSFKSYQTCVSEPCTTKYVLTQIK
jgi:hypothetical protein